MEKHEVLKQLEKLFVKFNRKGYVSLKESIEGDRFNEQTYMVVWLSNLFMHEKSKGDEREWIVPVLEYLEPILFCSLLDREVQGVEGINRKYNQYREVKERDERIE